ncbi:uro-adherence factor A [Procambarus clarkii]|uniref:uro-adherence factor A n=1 Tax=Procambarus clarkii TaxID=6728 RepID=UPI0037421ECB
MEQGKNIDQISREEGKEDMGPIGEENKYTKNGKENNKIQNDEPDAVGANVDHGKEKDFNVKDREKEEHGTADQKDNNDLFGGGSKEKLLHQEKDNIIMQVGKCQEKLDQKSEEEKLECDNHSGKESKADRNQEDNITVQATITGEAKGTHKECEGATGEEMVGHQNECQMNVDQGIKHEKITKPLPQHAEVLEQDREDGLRRKKEDAKEKPMNQEGMQCSTKNMTDLNHEAGEQEDGENKIKVQTDLQEENVREKSRNCNLEIIAENLENAEMKRQKSIDDMESQGSVIELENQTFVLMEVENEQNENSVETLKSTGQDVEDQEELGEKMEHQEQENLEVQPFTNLEQMYIEEGTEKNKNVEQNMESQNDPWNKQCMKKELELKKDIAKGLKCTQEGALECKHVFMYSKDAEQDVDNKGKQKVKYTKSGLEKCIDEESEVETNQEQYSQLDKHLHADSDLTESQEDTQHPCDEGKKSPVLGRRCVKIFFTSNKEGYKGSDSLNGKKSELANVKIGEGSVSREMSQNNTDSIEGRSVAICLEDKNLVESTSKDDTKLCGPIVRQFKYQPGHGTEESIGYQYPKHESETHAVVNTANIKTKNIIVTSSERQSSNKGSSACPLHGNPPRVSQDKIGTSEKIVECIDLLSDDDEEDNNATLKSATGSKPLQCMPETIVPKVCGKCQGIWNNNVLSAIFLGTESVTVNSKITYGAIICINNWADSHYLSGKETAVRSLLDRADLGKNIGSLKISEVNHWLGSLMKAGKVKCCDVFEAFYKPEANYKLVASLPDTDVITNEATENTRMVTPVDNRTNASNVQMRDNDIAAVSKNQQKKKLSQSPKNISSSLKDPSPSGSGHIVVSHNDSDSTSEKIRLSGAWDTPMFDGTAILVDKEQKDLALCSDTQKMASSGNAEESASKNGKVMNNEKSETNQIVQSVSDIGKSSCSKLSAQSSNSKTMPVLTSEDEALPISKKVVSSDSKKRISDVLTADSPTALRNNKSPGSKKMKSTVSKNTSPAVYDKTTLSSTEKTVASTSESNETSSSMTSSDLDTGTKDVVAQEILDVSAASSTLHPVSTVRTNLALSPSISTPNSFSQELNSTSGEQKSSTPKVRPKVLRSKKRQNVEVSARKGSSLLSSPHPLPSQDATVTSSDMSSQQSKCDPTVSKSVVDTLTRKSLRASYKKVANTEADTLTSQTIPIVSSTQEASSGKTSPVQSEHESEHEPIFNKEQPCSQEQQEISNTCSIQNSFKTSVHHADENSISSDSDAGGDEDNVSFSSEDNSNSTLCSVLGLNVSTLDTYSSSTDMKTMTNGVMSKNPSKKYKFSFSHYAMLKERSALSGLAREAFDLMPFESDNCCPLTHSTVGRVRFLTNRELLTLQSICILHPENPDVELFFRILVQILLTRNRVLLVPNSLTLLLIAENLRREFNRAKSKGTHAAFLSQDWDISNVYTAEDLWLSKLEHINEPTIRNVLSVFCLWKNLDKHIPNISLPEALQDLCKNINLAATDKTKLCIKLYARFCRYLYEEKNSTLAEFFLNQPFTGGNTPTSRNVLINTMVSRLSSDVLSLSSAGSLEIEEKEVQSALQKCLTSEKAVLSSYNARKEEELRLNVAMFKEKFDRYKEVNNLLVKRIQVVEKEKQELLSKIVHSKSKKLVKEFSQTLTAIHQSLAKRKRDSCMDTEKSRKALKQDNSTGIHSSVESCSRFSNAAVNIDLGEDVPQVIREGIYELLANEVDVKQVRAVIHTIMDKVVGEEAVRLPSDSWIRNFARLNGFIMKSK